MASINKVLLIGNLGADPETRYMPNGDAVTTVSIATTDKWKDRNSGEVRENTEWHRVIFFRKLAEIAGEYLKKGSPAYIEGQLRTRKWTDKQGVDRYTTEIVARDMKMLGSRPQNNGSGNGNGNTSHAPEPPAGSGFDDMDDDIPF